MPLDSSTTAYNTVPDLTSPTLEGLAWLLRHRETWPRGFRWDYSRGSTCAIGLAHRRWSDSFDFRVLSIPNVASAFKISIQEAMHVFGNDAYRPTKDFDVLPEMVVSRIDEDLLKYQTAFKEV